MQRGEHGLGAPGVLFFPVAQHLANQLALQVFLAAAQAARDDGELAVRGPARQVFFGHVGQRTDHDVATVVAHQLGRHALEFATEEHVQKEGLQHVVAVVTERDFGDLELVGHPVQNAPAQAAAQAAHGFALGDDFFDDAVGVLGFNVKLDAEFGQVLGQDVSRKAGLLLVQVDGHDFKVDRRALLHFEQDVQQSVAVFPTRDADHHAVALFNHVEVHDGLADLAAQALFKLVGFTLDFGFARCRGTRRRVSKGLQVRLQSDQLACNASLRAQIFGLRIVVCPDCIHHLVPIRSYDHCPVSMRIATSQSSKISSLAIFTRTPSTPGSCIRRLASLPIRVSSRLTCSAVHSSMMILRTLR